jgi:hypothetical protein
METAEECVRRALLLQGVPCGEMVPADVREHVNAAPGDIDRGMQARGRKAGGLASRAGVVTFILTEFVSRRSRHCCEAGPEGALPWRRAIEEVSRRSQNVNRKIIISQDDNPLIDGRELS